MSKRDVDRQAGHIWHDGRLAPWREVQVHVLSHSLHYGSAVFEGERVYDGRVFKLSAHTERLIASAAHVGTASMNVPVTPFETFATERRATRFVMPALAPER